MFKETRIQGVKEVQDNSLLAPKSTLSRESGIVLNSLNSLRSALPLGSAKNSLSPKSK